MAIKFVRRRVRYTLEFQAGNGILELEATRENTNPHPNLNVSSLGDLGEITDFGLLLELFGEVPKFTRLVRLRFQNGRRCVLRFRPRDFRDPADLRSDTHRLAGREVDSVQASHHFSLLGAANVVKFLADLDQILGDFGHGLPPRSLRRDASHTGIARPGS
jgi:hypothetical protein